MNKTISLIVGPAEDGTAKGKVFLDDGISLD
jgi:hypothetical protein